MAKRRKPREKNNATSAYADADGNVLTLRQELSRGTVRKLLNDKPGKAAATTDDIWQRREEALFERLAAGWEIAGLPMDDQKMLIGRYRMAGAEERRWVRETIARHVAEFIPELA
jgi:hypothetical protein